MFKRKLSLIVLIGFLFLWAKPIFAQVTSSGYAISIPIEETDLLDGDIICSYQGGFQRCDSEYDPAIYGVIADNASLAIEDSELENSRLALKNGVATVRVSASGGAISEGDFITSSETAGVGKLASRNGYVLGVALEDFSPDNQEEVGTIQVTLNIHPVAGLGAPSSNLIQFIRKGLTVPIFEPIESLRYLLAAAMVLIAFTLGLVYFGRTSRTGIEAIGRNPLARRVIQFTVVINIVLTIVIVLIGLGIAYLILIL